MLIIPAIDIKNGKVVRLTRGKYEETIYSDNPMAVALDWKDEGATILHIIDLDAAITDKKNNLAIVKDIARKIDLSIQFGGGLRNQEVIKEILDTGISKVIIGTKATDEQFLKSIISEFKDKVIVSIDELKGRFATHGWQKESHYSAREMIERLQSFSVNTVIYTDISKDGTMDGPNFERINDFLNISNISFIIAGGISSLEDIITLNNLKPNKPYGVIIGKALYERRFKLSEAIKITKKNND